MDKYFTTEEGKRVNIIEHTLEQLEKWPNLKIYIATDSQDRAGISRYATAIVYRYGHRGAHYIFFKEEVPRVRDMYSRLYDEAVRTIETAQLIDAEIPIAFEALEFDFNHVPKFNSNRLVSAIGGWVKGLNYRAVFKNSDKDFMIAAKAADHICRNKNAT